MACFFFAATATSAFQAKHQTIFPNKNLLQLKIREVRQRMMAEAQAGNGDQREASTPSATLATISTTTTNATTTTTMQMQVNKAQHGSNLSASNTTADDDQSSNTWLGNPKKSLYHHIVYFSAFAHCHFVPTAMEFRAIDDMLCLTLGVKCAMLGPVRRFVGYFLCRVFMKVFSSMLDLVNCWSVNLSVVWPVYTVQLIVLFFLSPVDMCSKYWEIGLSMNPI